MESKKEDSYVIGYKGLCSELSSKYNSEFKYEIGKRYKLESDKNLKLCKTGYHFCRNKQDVFNFYSIDGINNYRFFEIRAYGNIIDDEDLNKNGIPKKSVTDEIEIFREIPIQEFISFPDVNYVKINNKIPENLDLSACKNLESLQIWNCDSLKNLPEKLPENLETLEIWDCDSLKSIPENLPKNLQSLEILYCKNLKKLPENLPENLGTLEIKWCSSLKSIPEKLPRNLKSLEIKRCKNLKKLPENLPENLGTLEIKWCSSLKNLPEKLPRNLKSLEIKRCNSLENLPENLPKNLKYLEIWNCKNLKYQYWNKSE